MYIHTYVYIHIYGTPPHAPTFFVFLGSARYLGCSVPEVGSKRTASLKLFVFEDGRGGRGKLLVFEDWWEWVEVEVMIPNAYRRSLNTAIVRSCSRFSKHSYVRANFREHNLLIFMGLFF